MKLQSRKKYPQQWRAGSRSHGSFVTCTFSIISQSMQQHIVRVTSLVTIKLHIKNKNESYPLWSLSVSCERTEGRRDKS